MKLKLGVTLTYSKEIEAIVTAAEYAYEKNGAPMEVTVTSCNDGHHMPGSLHYENRAVDLRTGMNWVPPLLSRAQVQQIIYDMKTVLGKDFDVVLEVDHIHGEYDPKGARV
jgi:hypothetical protein